MLFFKFMKKKKGFLIVKKEKAVQLFFFLLFFNFCCFPQNKTKTFGRLRAELANRHPTQADAGRAGRKEKKTGLGEPGSKKK